MIVGNLFLTVLFREGFTIIGLRVQVFNLLDLLLPALYNLKWPVLNSLGIQSDRDVGVWNFGVNSPESFLFLQLFVIFEDYPLQHRLILRRTLLWLITGVGIFLLQRPIIVLLHLPVESLRSALIGIVVHLSRWFSYREHVLSLFTWLLGLLVNANWDISVQNTSFYIFGSLTPSSCRFDIEMA